MCGDVLKTERHLFEVINESVEVRHGEKVLSQRKKRTFRGPCALPDEPPAVPTVVCPGMLTSATSSSSTTTRYNKSHGVNMRTGMPQLEVNATTHVPVSRRVFPWPSLFPC